MTIATIVEITSDPTTKIIGIAQAPIHSMVIAIIVKREATWQSNVGLDQITTETTTVSTIEMAETGETTITKIMVITIKILMATKTMTIATTTTIKIII